MIKIKMICYYNYTIKNHNLSRVSRENWPDEAAATYQRQGAKSNTKEKDESNPVILN